MALADPAAALRSSSSHVLTHSLNHHIQHYTRGELLLSMQVESLAGRHIPRLLRELVANGADR